MPFLFVFHQVDKREMFLELHTSESNAKKQMDPFNNPAAHDCDGLPFVARTEHAL